MTEVAAPPQPTEAKPIGVKGALELAKVRAQEVGAEKDASRAEKSKERQAKKAETRARRKETWEKVKATGRELKNMMTLSFTDSEVRKLVLEGAKTDLNNKYDAITTKYREKQDERMDQLNKQGAETRATLNKGWEVGSSKVAGWFDTARNKVVSGVQAGTDSIRAEFYANRARKEQKSQNKELKRQEKLTDRLTQSQEKSRVNRETAVLLGQESARLRPARKSAAPESSGGRHRAAA